MMTDWADLLESIWNGNNSKMLPKKMADAYFKVRNGLSRRLKDMMPK
jgi:hypothetical protein